MIVLWLGVASVEAGALLFHHRSRNGALGPQNTLLSDLGELGAEAFTHRGCTV